jgi:hypothetical protein
MDCSIYAGAILTNDSGALLAIEDGDGGGESFFNLPYFGLGSNACVDESLASSLLGELGLVCELEGLLGVYTGLPIRPVLCFMYKARYRSTADLIEPRMRWMSPEALAAVPNRRIINSSIVRTALADFLAGKLYPLGIVTNLMYGKGLKA